MHIRPAIPDDAHRIHELHAAALRVLCAKDYTPAQIDSWVRFRSVDEYRRAIVAALELTRLAIVDGLLAGYATYCPQEGELAALFVDPAAARHGVGRTLLADAERQARRDGHPVLHLQSTRTSVGFYQKAGYEIIGPTLYTLPDKTPLECVRMQRSLNSVTA